MKNGLCILGLFSFVTFAKHLDKKKVPLAETDTGNFQRCIVSICGEASSVGNLEKLEAAHTASELPPELRQELEGALDHIMLNKTASTLQSEAAFAHYVREPANAEEPTEYHTFTKALFLVKVMDKAVWEVSADDETETLNRTKTAAALPTTLTAAEKSQICDMLASSAAHDLETETDNIWSLPVNVYLQNREGIGSPADKFKLDAEGLLQTAAEIRPRVPKSILEIFAASVRNAKKFLAGEALTEPERVRLEYDLAMVRWLNNLASHPEKTPAFAAWRGFTFTELVRMFPTKSYQQSAQYAEHFSLSDAKYVASKTAIMNGFAARYWAFGQLRNKEAVRRLVQSDAHQVVESLKGVLSEKTLGNIGLEKMPLHTPPTRPEYLAEFRAELKKDLEISPSEFQGLSPQEQKYSAKIRFISLIDRAHENDLWQLEMLELISKRELAGDANYDVLEGGLKISAFSQISAQAERGTLMHELGHAVRNEFGANGMSKESFARFAQIRQCLSARHSGKRTQSFAYMTEDSPSQYVSHKEIVDIHAEEDWADLIAGINSPANESNYVCNFLPQLGGKYVVGKLLDDEGADKHSTPLFRLLHLETLRSGKLPPECEAGLAEQKTKVNFKSCL